MNYMKDLLRNLIILLVIIVVLFIFFRETMAQIFQVFGGLFGPVAILMLIIFALPRKRRS